MEIGEAFLDHPSAMIQALVFRLSSVGWRLEYPSPIDVRPGLVGHSSRS